MADSEAVVGDFQEATKIARREGWALPMPKSAKVFQRLLVKAIGYGLWTPRDQARSYNEGWAIGNRIDLQTLQATIRIGKWGGAFVSDADAQVWVQEQADRDEPHFNIYRRALAVVAALTIRQVDRNTE